MRTAAHPLFLTWVGMHLRCFKTDSPGYASYGGRGITVCERWDDFYAFTADMGERPEGHQLDRIDCDKGYEPSNCRWVTRKQNGRNQRKTVRVEHQGQVVPLIELAEKHGIQPATAYVRWKKGWPLEAVLEADTTAYSGRYKDMSGSVFGRLTVVSIAHSDRHYAYWNCKCSCGKTLVVAGRQLRRGKTRSCGCLLAEYRATKLKTIRRESLGKTPAE